MNSFARGEGSFVMIRNLLTTSVLIAMTATAATAQQTYDGYFNPPSPRGGPLDLGPTRYVYPHSQLPLSERQAEQLVRWANVGQCVAARDREGSLSYVSAKPNSPDAAAAARRLDAAFASCLAGSGVMAKNNKTYRRAAVADALGVRPSSS
jgi:hypothetical protein